MKKALLPVFVLMLLINPALKSQWFPQTSSNVNTFSSVWAIDANTAYATTQFSVYKTSNAGVTWSVNLSATAYFDDVVFANPNTGYVIGRASGGAHVYKTIDGGANWTIIGNIPVLTKFSFSLRNPDTLYAGTFGGIYRTRNGGINWENIYGGPSSFTSLFFVNDTSAWATTDVGNIFKSVSAGVTWSATNISDAYPLFNCYFLNLNTGWVVSGNSRIYKSTNAGWIPWTYTTTNIPNCELDAVYFANDMTGWVCGCQGSINRSTDGGITWTQQTVGTTSQLTDIKFVNSLTGWSVGESGRILYTTNGGVNPVGIEPVSNEMPDKFQLKQNYPNPFNPSTVIKFEVTKLSSVKLAIFDILGNEMSAPVKETLNPGTYEIKFDGGNLPSGVYYYKISASSMNNVSEVLFSETKKMVLIK